MTPVEINLDFIKAAATAASSDGLRFYLNGVAIEARNGSVVVVATDGHRLLAFEAGTTATNEDWRYIIPLDVVKNLKTNKKLKDVPGVLAKENETQLSITYAGTKTVFGFIDGTFPDWQRVVPKEINGELGQYNPDYLSDLKKAAKLTGQPSNGSADIVIGHNGTGPAIVNLPITSKHVAVVMPLRLDSSFNVTQDFVVSLHNYNWMKAKETSDA